MKVVSLKTRFTVPCLRGITSFKRFPIMYVLSISFLVGILKQSCLMFTHPAVSVHMDKDDNESDDCAEEIGHLKASVNLKQGTESFNPI